MKKSQFIPPEAEIVVIKLRRNILYTSDEIDSLDGDMLPSLERDDETLGWDD